MKMISKNSGKKINVLFTTVVTVGQMRSHSNWKSVNSNRATSDETKLDPSTIRFHDLDWSWSIWLPVITRWVRGWDTTTQICSFFHLLTKYIESLVVFWGRGNIIGIELALSFQSGTSSGLRRFLRLNFQLSWPRYSNQARRDNEKNA